MQKQKNKKDSSTSENRLNLTRNTCLSSYYTDNEKLNVQTDVNLKAPVSNLTLDENRDNFICDFTILGTYDVYISQEIKEYIKIRRPFELMASKGKHDYLASYLNPDFGINYLPERYSEIFDYIYPYLKMSVVMAVKFVQDNFHGEITIEEIGYRLQKRIQYILDEIQDEFDMDEEDIANLILYINRDIFDFIYSNFYSKNIPINFQEAISLREDLEENLIENIDDQPMEVVKDLLCKKLCEYVSLNPLDVKTLMNIYIGNKESLFDIVNISIFCGTQMELIDEIQKYDDVRTEINQNKLEAYLDDEAAFDTNSCYYDKEFILKNAIFVAFDQNDLNWLVRRFVKGKDYLRKIFDDAYAQSEQWITKNTTSKEIRNGHWKYYCDFIRRNKSGSFLLFNNEFEIPLDAHHVSYHGIGKVVITNNELIECDKLSIHIDHCRYLYTDNLFESSDSLFRMATLGKMHYIGNVSGIKLNRQVAFKLLHTTAKQGNPESMYYLGRLYCEDVISFDRHQLFKQAEKAAVDGDADAMILLAKLYRNNDGIDVDSETSQKQAIFWLKKAIKNGSVLALSKLATVYQGGSNNLKKKAFPLYLNAAKAGDYDGFAGVTIYGRNNNLSDKELEYWWSKDDKVGRALDENSVELDLEQLFLEREYYNTESIREYQVQGFQWTQKSVKAGYIEAMTFLGELYLNAIGTQQDFNKAYQYFYQAAENESSLAMEYLGNMYIEGKGVNKSLSTAIYWLELAAKQGNTSAMCTLVDLYSSECDVKDLKKAVEWARLAADESSGTSAKLGVLMYKGLGIEQNKEQAILLFKEAAENASSEAMEWLGKISEEEGDNVSALLNYRQAAFLGNKSVFCKIGEFYIDKVDIDRNYYEAIRWLRRAQRVGDNRAERLIATMSIQPVKMSTGIGKVILVGIISFILNFISEDISVAYRILYTIHTVKNLSDIHKQCNATGQKISFSQKIIKALRWGI